MLEHSSLYNSKVLIFLFLVCCIILTLVYYDLDFLKCNSVVSPTEEAFLEIQENTSIASTNHTIQTPHEIAISVSGLSTMSSPLSIPLASSPLINNTTPTSKTSNFWVTRKYQSPKEDIKFLVSSSKCKIIDLDAFNRDAKKYFRPEQYKPCRQHELLTYVTKSDNTTTLHIDNELVPSYSSNGVSCCYSNVTRKKDISNPDNDISVSVCKHFENNVTLYHNLVIVKCTEARSDHLIYENAHVALTINAEIRKKIEAFDNNTKPFSILMIGIDSISRLQFIRALPRTHQFVEENEWIPLKGYNKMDDNTFPNLMAILTGFESKVAYNICMPTVVGKLDKCPMLWYDFRKLGFITAYGEDEGSISTFNYRKKGFRSPPADYYFRPYILATEQLTKKIKDSMLYCTGPETAGERIMNLVKDFSITFKNYPSFGFFWMNSFSHNKINSVTGMDGKVKQLLVNLKEAGILEDTMVIFLSDHGIRFGDIRLTETGWLEERLPFIYVHFPKWFKDKFATEIDNFKNNTNKLTSPYDLHMTLKHILHLLGKNFTVTKSYSCPKCRSVFEEIPTERSCTDAGLKQHWCTCSGYTNIILTKIERNVVMNFILHKIEDIIRSRTNNNKCAKFSVEKVLATRISQYMNQNQSYLLVQLEMKPKAVFEGTLRYFGDISSQNFSLSGTISRLDSYSDHSKCVSDAYLKKYCYCLIH